MTPTEKHREMAGQCLEGMSVAYKGSGGLRVAEERIARALAKAEREGMKHAAEIVCRLIPHMPPDGPINLEHQAEYEALGFAMQVILSEAGEG